MVANPCRLNNEFSSLIWSIKELLKRDWHVRINYIYREANYVPDCMANLAISFRLGLHIFMSPENVKSLLFHDIYVVAYPHLVSSYLFVESPFVTKKKKRTNKITGAISL